MYPIHNHFIVLLTRVLVIMFFGYGTLMGKEPHASSPTTQSKSLSNAQAHTGKSPNETLRTRALRELRRALNEEVEFVKVHAAEDLLSLNQQANVHEVFAEEQRLHGDEPKYRIGIWRVLARSAQNATERKQYYSRIREAVFNPASSDRAQAVEALAKLRYQISAEDRPKFEKLSSETVSDEAPFHRWLLSVSGASSEINALAQLLDDPHDTVRGNTAYAIRHLHGKLSTDVAAKLANVVSRLPVSKSRVYVVSAAYVSARQENEVEKFKNELLEYATSADQDAKCEVTAALAERGDDNDIPLLIELLNDPSPDVRVGAAYAILQIGGPH